MPSHFATNSDLAELFLNVHDDGTWFRDPNYDGPCEAIDPDKIEKLANEIHDLIANIVSSILNVGSERDAVNENEDLNKALVDELKGWTAR